MIGLICTILLFAASGAKLDSEESAVVKQWLDTNKAWRLATEADCPNKKALAQHRKKVGRYHPFIARDDFNADGENDLAVVVFRGSREAVLIFNGDENGLQSRRAALLPVRKPPRYLFFSPSVGMLLVGLFNSDDFDFVAAKADGYELRENIVE